MRRREGGGMRAMIVRASVVTALLAAVLGVGASAASGAGPGVRASGPAWRLRPAPSAAPPGPPRAAAAAVHRRRHGADVGAWPEPAPRWASPAVGAFGSGDAPGRLSIAGRSLGRA